MLSWSFDRWAELASDRAGQPRVEADALCRRAALGVLVQLAWHAEEDLSAEATDRFWNVEATLEPVGRELSNDVPELGDSLLARCPRSEGIWPFGEVGQYTVGR